MLNVRTALTFLQEAADALADREIEDKGDVMAGLSLIAATINAALSLSA